MSDIQYLIETLKSVNPNKRYDACEELRVSRYQLPPEAIDALDSATNDSNSDVADAAKRALVLHRPQLTPDVVVEKEREKVITNTVKYWPLIGLLVALAPILILKNIGFTTLGASVFGTLGFLLAQVGAYTGKKRIGTVFIGAALGSIGSILLAFLFIAYMCQLSRGAHC